MQLAVLVLVIWAGGVVAGGGDSDTDALFKFKQGITDDPSGRILGSWTRANLPKSGGCPLNWYGVQCGDTGISSVTLEDMGLVGNISFSVLAGMGNLRNLSLSNNSFTGVLSPELALVGSLEFLDLSRNSFTGQIPVELARLENLVLLNLSSNNFGGSVRPAFGNLTRLEYLDLHGNSFSGDLDGILAQLQSAVYVDLSWNQFSGSLKSISDNSSIASSLQYLNISHNGFSGKLFSGDLVPLFDSLEVFDASFNQLSGNVPSFNFIVSLEILRLGNNQFSGSLPEALLKESSMVLNELDLSHNQLTGPVTSITSATLKNLNLSMNQLSGSLPARVGSCAVVDMSNNKLSGNLSKVHIWGNYVEVIDLSSNELTGTLPNETSQFLRLISFKASNNLLAGEVPLVIGTYPELNVVDFSLNELSGLIPPSLFTSSRLTKLNLSGNSFTGPIPFPNYQREMSTSSDASFTTQTSLVSLDLSNNSLSGTLPPQIIAMTGLNLLDIGRNNITGSIPKEIGMLHSLLYLDLSNNHFEGHIPDHLPDSLQGLDVSYNNLSGIVPDNLMRFPDSSFHPGNSLLIFPHVPPSNVSSFSVRGKHDHRMKYVITYALIVGGLICVAVILLSLFFYYRVNGKFRRKNNNQRRSPVHHRHHKTPDLPPVSSFSQDQLLESRSISIALEDRDLSLPARKSGEPEIQEISTIVDQFDHTRTSIISPKNKGKSSMSLIISSPAPHDPYLDEHPSVISVGSPDRLAGSLHLFDNSFILSAEELSRAPAEIIGRSCHGTSYEATIDSGYMLTVKWLREGIWKGKKEFAREAKKLGNIRHPNIVLLRGYYWGPKEHERLIISDYINAASLTAYICESETRKLRPLSLTERLSIAVDIARGLDYLHNERAIPHGNLKSTNILIQNPNLKALLADYSLHRIMTPSGMAEQVLNAGALGYRPPEFASTTKPCPSLKGDVYAFGVILLELLTGKNAGEIVSGNRGLVDLTDWVRLLASENRSYECFDRIIPEVNCSEGPPKALEDTLHVALRCIRSASERPEIRTVLEDLSSISS